MKHIKLYENFGKNETLNESLVDGILGAITAVGIVTGYDVIKSLIPYGRFKLAEREIKGLLKPYMNDPVLDNLCNDYKRTLEESDSLVDYMEIMRVSKLVDERISELLPYEDYLKYKKYVDKYNDRDLIDR